MRTETKKMKVLTDVLVEVYEPGDVIDVSECNPKGKTFEDLRKADRAIVLGVVHNDTGSNTYRVLVNHGTDGWHGFRATDVSIMGAHYIKHWTREELLEVEA